MSFIGNGTKGTVYAPGHFLAHEECVRETKEISQSGATTTESGAKYVKMGTAYPSNDANAIGIVYEDVDVSTGNMPGSVVTKGIVYEDRLAITGKTYSAVTPEGTENPSEEGWYEKSGDVYSLSEDTTVTDGKTYYEVSGVARLSSAAKTALEAKGFKFVTESTVTRPY
jgi:hypothetical protein